MKNTVFLALFLAPFFLQAQSSPYEVKTFLDKGIKGANVHHRGDAWLNFLIQADEDFTYNVTQATFSPNATLDWHKHKTDQVIIILSGLGHYQERGKEVVVLKKGDVIKCDKDTEHWHTSTPESEVSYLAIYGSSPTIWTEKVTEEYYTKAIEKIQNN